MNKTVEADVEALAEEVKQLRAAIDKIVGLLGQTARDGSDEAIRLPALRSRNAMSSSSQPQPTNDSSKPLTASKSLREIPMM